MFNTLLRPSTPPASSSSARLPKLQPHGHDSLLTPPSTPPLPSSAAFASSAHDGPLAGAESSRRLSSNELSYFLPSRASGVNDMYLHHHVETSQPELFARERIEVIWAILRVRHPLLAARVERGDCRRMDDWFFSTRAPVDVEDAIEEAYSALSFRSYPSSAELISRYLNGPRLLSAARLSHLTVSQSTGPEGGYDVVLCTTHFVGDGLALHTLMNEFYVLVGAGESTWVLEGVLEDELEARRASGRSALPLSIEDRLAPHPQARSPAKRAASRAAYAHSQRSAVGGQTLPRAAHKAPVHTAVPTHAYTPAESARLLKTCKAHGVSFASALFAVVGLAWARVRGSELDPKEPMLFYSALNMRTSLPALPSSASASYFHLALGYYTITLPSFPPASAAAFWHRCHAVKQQTAQAVKAPFLVGKALAESAERAERAVRWAIIDDEAERVRQEEQELAGLGVVGWRPPPAPLPAVVSAPPPPKPVTPPPVYSSKPAPTNTPLLGLSLLGNLDAIYVHASYPALALTRLTTGSRQRPGAALLFGYTFAGKTYLSLGYDVNGFAEGAMERLWEEIKGVTGEMLVGQ